MAEGLGVLEALMSEWESQRVGDALARELSPAPADGPVVVDEETQVRARELLAGRLG